MVFSCHALTRAALHAVQLDPFHEEQLRIVIDHDVQVGTSLEPAWNQAVQADPCCPGWNNLFL